MNQFAYLSVLAFVSCLSVISGLDCNSVLPESAFKGIVFSDMKDNCSEATEQQIVKEITASLKYLSMAAYFTKDEVNRPGFAKLFFDAASEEREHAHHLIDYLQMRGRYSGQFKANIDIAELVKKSEEAPALGKLQLDNIAEPTKPANDRFITSSGLAALQNALKMEKAVTTSIRDLIVTCEKDDDFNHYHFVDYLTGEFLTEQYKGQHDLAAKISTLSKMLIDNGAELADFLFDKKLM